MIHRPVVPFVDPPPEPETDLTPFHQGWRSFAGLKGRAWWLNFVGEADAAQAPQRINDAGALVPRFTVSGSKVVASQAQLRSNITGLSLIPFSIDTADGVRFVATTRQPLLAHDDVPADPLLQAP